MFCLNKIRLFSPDVFALDAQRAEGLAAVFIEFAEELKALETQVVHVAAENIQAEVQAMAYKEDDYEGEHREHTFTPEPFAGMAAMVLNTCATTPPASMSAMIREYERISPNQPVSVL